MDKIRIKEAIIVEGRYDKAKVSGVFDTLIIETGGFRIFENIAKMKLIRTLAQKRGIIIFTDSDGAGLIIRNYIKGSVNKGEVKHAYIPQIEGKERRKKEPSKEGFLGVEGINNEIIKTAIMSAAKEKEYTVQKEQVTKYTLYADGLSGKKGSLEKRKKMLSKLGAPTNLSANALKDIINSIMSYDEYKAFLKDIK